MEQLMRRCRDVASDILHQPLDALVVLESQDQLSPDDHLERHHADAPEVPVLAPIPRVWVDSEVLVVIGH